MNFLKTKKLVNEIQRYHISKRHFFSSFCTMLLRCGAQFFRQPRGARQKFEKETIVFDLFGLLFQKVNDVASHFQAA